MKVKKSFYAEICLGFREGYTQKTHSIDEAYLICHEFCNRIGLCVTVSPTRFIYTRGTGIADGYEDGCLIRLIAYPRFPQSKYDIVALSIDLAKIFLVAFKQNRISIVTTEQTFLIEAEDIK
jgi:hypothetical protein